MAALRTPFRFCTDLRATSPAHNLGVELHDAAFLKAELFCNRVRNVKRTSAGERATRADDDARGATIARVGEYQLGTQGERAMRGVMRRLRAVVAGRHDLRMCEEGSAYQRTYQCALAQTSGSKHEGLRVSLLRTDNRRRALPVPLGR